MLQPQGEPRGEHPHHQIEENHYVYYDFHPLCHDLWPDASAVAGLSYDVLLHSMINVNSASRGTFGVPHELQEFGQGDQLFLDLLLSRFRASVQHIVEFGTLRGVTSLYLGYVRESSKV